MTNINSLKAAWDDSYGRGENHLFWPSDEAIKFISRYLRRRVGHDEIVDVLPGAQGSRFLDVGCGIGRYLTFGTTMGFEMYGNDLSARAVSAAQDWLIQQVGPEAKERVVASDITSLPWGNGFFDHAMSDSVLDSMPFEVAQAGLAEVARVTKANGYFYCSLISGDESGRDPGFSEEVVVTGRHEANTIQSYFDYIKIKRLLEPFFEIKDCYLVQMHNHNGVHYGRWHVVSRRR